MYSSTYSFVPDHMEFWPKLRLKEAHLNVLLCVYIVFVSPSSSPPSWFCFIFKVPLKDTKSE